MNIADARRRAEELQFLNAFISMTAEDGDGPVLAVKDLIDVAGIPTTGGGILLPSKPATADAPVVARLRAAGYVVIGKTNLHEFAWGITSLNPHYGYVRNPHDPDRIAGGSSGGSAVAVAAGMADLALGTDTGGSIRIPAALCGVVGVKPTLGLLPTDGVIPLSPSLDTVGPLAPSVEACGRAFGWLARSPDRQTVEQQAAEPDTLQATRVGAPASSASVGVESAYTGGPASPRLAVPEGWLEKAELDPEVASVWHRVSDGLPRIPFPDRAALARAADTVLPFEALAYHRRWFERTPDRYGDDLRARLTAAYLVTEADYRAALEDLARLREEADRAMATIDALLLPTVPTIAPTIVQALAHDPRRELTMFTRPFNATGQPVVALPLRVPGLPVGVQLAGRRGGDSELLRLAALIESSWSPLLPERRHPGLPKA